MKVLGMCPFRWFPKGPARHPEISLSDPTLIFLTTSSQLTDRLFIWLVALIQCWFMQPVCGFIHNHLAIYHIWQIWKYIHGRFFPTPTA
jgi:hypothetical protein